MSKSTPDRPLRLGRGIRDRLAAVRGTPRPESSDRAATRISETLATHAVHLSLAYCQLSAIPPEVFEMAWLESLDLSGNNITHIPGAIASLTNSSNAKSSRQSAISYSAKHRRAVRTRTPSSLGNALPDLSTSLHKLKSLRVASLADNDFKAVPDAVTRWSSLECLDLGHNQGNIVMVRPPRTTVVGSGRLPTTASGQ